MNNTLKTRFQKIWRTIKPVKRSKNQAQGIVYPIRKDEWRPKDTRHLNKKENISDKWYHFCINHSRITKTWNFIFNLTYGNAFHHYKAFYRLGFFFQFSALILDQKIFAVCGLLLAVIGFLTDKWAVSTRIIVFADSVRITQEEIRKFEEETVRGSDAGIIL